MNNSKDNSVYRMPKMQSEMTRDELIDYLRSELERVKKQRNDSEASLRIREKELDDKRKECKLYESYINRTKVEEDQQELWQQAATDLFKKHNPDIKLTETIGARLYAGFSKDMDYLKSKYHLIKK